MDVEVRIPAMLRRLTDGSSSLTVPGETIGEIIEHLEQQYQGIRSELVSDDGSIHRFVNIYLNDEDIRFMEKLDTPVSTGDVISILPALAGGAGADQARNCTAIS